MAKCEICEKTAIHGNKLSITRSHISKRAPRTWKPNLRTVKADVDGEIKRIHVCAKCLKNGKVKRIILEVQLSPNDCLSKYYNFRENVIENTKWQVMPVLYVVNNQNLKKKLNDLKIIYDDLKLEKVGDFID